MGAIIGGIFGVLALVGLLAALAIMFHRRRRLRAEPPENKRWTFHREKMVRPPVVDIRRPSSARLGIPITRPMIRSPSRLMPRAAMTESQASMYSQTSSHVEDIERQRLPPLPHDDIISAFPKVPPHDDILSTFPIVMMSSPSLPRMAFPRPRHLPDRPLEPLRPLPPPPDEEEIRVQMLRKSQLTELEKSPKPMLHLNFG